MTQGGPNPPGDGPDDPGADGPESDDGQDDAGPPHGGWLPPEQRSWRHPSELFASPGAAGSPGASAKGAPDDSGRGARRLRRHRTSTTVAAGAVAAAAVVVGAFALTSSVVSTGGPSPAGPTSASGPAQVPATMASTARSMVILTSASSSGAGTSEGPRCGVAVASGGWVATTADLSPAGSLVAVTADGTRVEAKVVASDTTSDVALVRVAANVPVARFDDDRYLRSGGRVIDLDADPPSLHPGDRYRWAWQTVATVGQAVRAGPGAGMAAIVANGPGAELDGQGVLVDSEGHVVGLRDGQPDAAQSPRHGEVFLPSSLVTGVAADLASTGGVDHGWLGIDGTDAPGSSPAGPGALGMPGASGGAGQQPSTTSLLRRPSGPGAMVQQVRPTGAAAGRLRAGDLIVSVDGAPVRSMAELRSRLYVLPPGSTVRLEVERSDGERQLNVELASSP